MLGVSAQCQNRPYMIAQDGQGVPPKTERKTLDYVAKYVNCSDVPNGVHGNGAGSKLLHSLAGSIPTLRSAALKRFASVIVERRLVVALRSAPLHISVHVWFWKGLW